MAKTPQAKRGRPAHVDDPPKAFTTTLPTSAFELLTELAEQLDRPRSELLAEMIRAYARRFPDVLKAVTK